MYEKWGFNEEVGKYRKMFDTPELYNLTNPGVPIIFFVQRNAPTPSYC